MPPLQYPFLAVLWLAMGTFMVWLWMSSVRFATRRILGTYLGASFPTARQWLLTAALTPLLWTVLIPLLLSQLWLWGAPWTGGEIGGVAVVSMAAFGFLWTLLRLALGMQQVFCRISPPRCPSCKSVLGGETVGAACGQCGETLARWLVLGNEIDQEA
jgi:hypothetical protein